MSLLLLLAPLAMLQVDPITGAQTGPSALPQEIIDKQAMEARKRARQEAEDAQSQPPAPAAAGSGCIDAVDADPEHAVEVTRTALNNAMGRERVRAGMCLGVAYTALDEWGEAQQAFTAARNAADEGDHPTRARLGAMAGNAALAAGNPAEALALLAPAEAEAKQAGDKDLVVSIDIDRARALVGVQQPVEAGVVLATVRAADPANAQAWLLSATLSRRLGNLAEAQVQIEKAAQLAPANTLIGSQIGLEAGVIAMLAKHPDAARKSWNAVIQSAPESDAATTAKDYLAQLGQLSSQSQPAPAAAAIVAPKPR